MAAERDAPQHRRFEDRGIDAGVEQDADVARVGQVGEHVVDRHAPAGPVPQLAVDEPAGLEGTKQVARIDLEGDRARLGPAHIAGDDRKPEIGADDESQIVTFRFRLGQDR